VVIPSWIFEFVLFRLLDTDLSARIVTVSCAQWRPIVSWYKYAPCHPGGQLGFLDGRVHMHIHTHVFRWRAAREREWARTRSHSRAGQARMYCIYIMYVCMCAYVKILHNGILHNGLCPSRSWKEMKNEALLSTAPRRSVSFRCGVRACVLAYVLLTRVFLYTPFCVSSSSVISVLNFCVKTCISVLALHARIPLVGRVLR